MATYATPSAPHESDEHRPITPHLFGFYDNANDLEPSKHISLDELTELVTNPLFDTNKENLPVIRVHDGLNNSKEASSSANYWAAVLNIEIKDPEDELYFLVILNEFYLDGNTHQTLFFPTNSPSGSLDESGNQNYVNSYTVIIPFQEPLDEETYKSLWAGLNVIGKSGASSADWLNGFSAPNKRIFEMDYNGDCYGTEYLSEGTELFRKAMDAYAELEAKVQTPAEPSDDAKFICNEFVSEIKNLLNLEKTLEEIAAELEVNPYVVDRIIQETIRNAVRKDELLILNKDEYLNNHSRREAWPHILFNYGEPYNRNQLNSLKNQHFKTYRTSSANKSTKGYEKELTSKINSALESLVYWHIEQHNQRSEIGYRVDMFAQKRRVELQESRAVFTLTYKPILAREDLATLQYDQAIIDDYKLHFPEFDEFLQFLVMARFSPDRKKAYLWLHAPSDWGKGFLKSVLKNMGISTELSVTEVESIFEGKPAGREPNDFIRALCIVFDEFKKVKAELKQLENTITLIPKFKMASEVEVFGKLFLSAENVSSLIGPSGVEDQLANRFSCIVGKGAIHKRPFFNAIGSGEYIRHVTGYAQTFINTQIADMQKQGRLKAERKAEIFINNFHTKYGIDKVSKRLSESLVDVADDFLTGLYHSWESNEAWDSKYLPFLYLNASGGLCLRNGGKVLQSWMDECIDPSEIATLRHKKLEILKLISQDGTGEHKSIHVPGSRKSHRAILLKPHPEASSPETFSLDL